MRLPFAAADVLGLRVCVEAAHEVVFAVLEVAREDERLASTAKYLVGLRVVLEAPVLDLFFSLRRVVLRRVVEGIHRVLPAAEGEQVVPSLAMCTCTAWGYIRAAFVSALSAALRSFAEKPGPVLPATSCA